MIRHSSYCLCLLIISSCGLLLVLANVEFEPCSSYASAGSVCTCQTIGERLLANCTGHVGPLRTEDVLCCKLMPDENATSSNEILTNPSTTLPTAGFEPEDFEALYTVGSDLQEFDFRILNNFTNLHTLNISRSQIVNVTWENCSLPALKVFDLSYNNLRNLSEGFFMCNRTLSVLGLAGTPLNCQLLSWFIDWARKPDTNLEIPEKNNILCYYYSMAQPESLRSAYIWQMIESCPKNCSCALARFDIMQVDCSGRDFYDFPEYVPYNTRVIHMENNKIRSFQRILNLTSYQNVTTLYLDNNAIESLKELEGIQRYLRLYTLHLAGNRITHLSAYIMEQLEADSIKLGGNPWHCDCKHGTSLLNYLLENDIRKVQDRENITCASTDPKHANKLVQRLTPTDLCYSESTNIHPLDIVNIILALLIVIVLVKLVYDWWQYKHKGQLPAGPTYIAQMWKQRRPRLNHVQLDCTKGLLAQKEPSSPSV